MYRSINQAIDLKQELLVVAESTAQLLVVLDKKFADHQIVESTASADLLSNLCELMKEVSAFVAKRTMQPFLKTLFTKDQTSAKLETFQRRVTSTIQAFQVAAILDGQDWQQKMSNARKEDRKDFEKLLRDLQSNHKKLLKTLDADPKNSLAIISALQKRSEEKSLDGEIDTFCSYALLLLSSATGSTPISESWMISSYDVEFGDQIGSGGFGTVFAGTWNMTSVAIKVLRFGDIISPDIQLVKREIDIWKRLTHPHIVQFLGANVMDDPPFLVMPLLSNGNIKQYMRKSPAVDRLRLLIDASLGLIYLHSQNIVHGDIKAVNILVDDAKKAVLCDFGLTQMKVDVTTKIATIDADSELLGSRNWMSPERLRSGRLTFPGDVYSFGMTIYEVLADEVPFAYMPAADIFSLVLDGQRPTRPNTTDCPRLNDHMWGLIVKCWEQEPNRRPDSKSVCRSLKQIEKAVVSENLVAPDIAPPATFPATSSAITDLDLRVKFSAGDRCYKVVIVGDGGTGKTALLTSFSECLYSKGVLPECIWPKDFWKIYAADIEYQGTHIELSMWDTQGQEDYDRIRPLYYPDSHGVLICFAIDSPDSLDCVIEKWISEAMHFMPGLPKVLVGCKKDLRNDPRTISELCKTNQRPVMYEEGMAMAEKINASYVECSAKTGEGVPEVFQAMVSLTNKKKERRRLFRFRK